MEFVDIIVTSLSEAPLNQCLNSYLCLVLITGLVIHGCVSRKKQRLMRGLSAGATKHQLHLITYGDFATFNHKTVEREFAVEAPVDAASDFLVLDQRVGIVCGHDATQAQILDSDEHLAYAQAAAWPLTLSQSFDATDHNIGPQAAMVVTKGGDGSVGGHQQRQHIEALNAIIAYQLRTRSGCSMRLILPIFSPLNRGVIALPENVLKPLAKHLDMLVKAMAIKDEAAAMQPLDPLPRRAATEKHTPTLSPKGK
jgi:hypothetical protein